MNKNFWKSRNILITGFEGFIGSNLIRKLIPCGVNIVGIDIQANREKTILTNKDYEKIIVIKGNISNYSLVKDILWKYKIEIIFHLAAEAIVDRCIQNPTRAFSSNIQGTWNILDNCRKLNTIRTIIVASSDKAYGSHKQLPYKEETPLRGEYPYDVSKACTDLIAHTYFNTYNLPVVIMRCGNIYGPGDFNFSRIIPDAIKCALSGKTFFIRSDGKFTRDYVYVEDIINAYILLSEKSENLNLYGKAFNFSIENPISVIELVKKIYRLSGKDFDYKIINQVKYEIRHQFLSSQRARETLNWKPKFHLEKGLKKTIQWYKKYFGSII